MKKILSLVLVVVMMWGMCNIQTTAAETPVITSHRDGAYYDANEIGFIRWQPVSGATRYRLAMKSVKDNSYAADVYWEDNLTVNKYWVDEDNIKDGHTYKIWVGACRNGHDDLISSYYIFVNIYESDDDDYYEDDYDYGYFDDDGYNSNYYYNDEDERESVCNCWQFKLEYLYTVHEIINGNDYYHNAVDYNKQICIDCGKVQSENARGFTKKEYHNFYGDICSDCGYEKETVCACDDYRKDYQYSIFSRNWNNDAYYHYETKYYNHICNDCGKTIAKNQEGETVSRSHNFTGNTCEDCSYKRACVHSNCRQEFDFNKPSQIVGDSVYHSVVTYNKKVCQDCYAVTERNIWAGMSNGYHSFSGNTCTECGYVKVTENIIPSTSGTSIKEQLKAMTEDPVYKVGTIYEGEYEDEECKGFAKDVFKQLFGYNIGSTAPNDYTIIYNGNNTRCVDSTASLNTTNVVWLFSNARPGDFVQMERRKTYGPHSAIVYAVSETGVTFYEANTKTPHNIITLEEHTWKELSDKNGKMSVYTAKNYEQKNIVAASSKYTALTAYNTPITAYTMYYENVSMYADASANSTVVGTIYGNSECTIESIFNNGWCKVSCNGIVGYVPTYEFIYDTSLSPYTATIIHSGTEEWGIQHITEVSICTKRFG